MPFKYPSMRERIVANSSLSTEHTYLGDRCWDWLGRTTTNRGGEKYGTLTVRVKGKVVTRFAHRMSVEAFHGEVPIGVTKHLCNNTLCVNPGHLEAGTQASNVAQALREERLMRNPVTGRFATPCEVL